MHKKNLTNFLDLLTFHHILSPTNVQKSLCCICSHLIWLFQLLFHLRTCVWWLENSKNAKWLPASKSRFRQKRANCEKTFLPTMLCLMVDFLEGRRNISVLNQFWGLLKGFFMISARQNVNETWNDWKLLHHYHIKKSCHIRKQ